MLPAMNGMASVLYLTEVFQGTSGPLVNPGRRQLTATDPPPLGKTKWKLTTEETEATSNNPIGPMPNVNTGGIPAPTYTAAKKGSTAEGIIAQLGARNVLASLVVSVTLIAILTLK
jgi:hypothetical protein